jgi:hypothetical protein
MSDVTLRYYWCDDLGNYCASEKFKEKWVRKEPLEILMVNEKLLSEFDFMDTVQSVYYKRHGKILQSFSVGDFINLAKELGIYSR